MGKILFLVMYYVYKAQIPAIILHNRKIPSSQSLQHPPESNSYTLKTVTSRSSETSKNNIFYAVQGPETII